MVRYSPHSLLLLSALSLSGFSGRPTFAHASSSDDHDHDDHSHGGVAAEWQVHPTRMPSPLSDHSATILPSVRAAGNARKSQIVIAGGCDHPEGNAFVDAAAGEMDYFACDRLTDQVWAFDPEGTEGDGGVGEDGDGRWKRLADMPRERYRHAAVEANGKLILVGGRTVSDEMIPEIDVYDPSTDTWSTPGTLAEGIQTADNAAFVNKKGTALFVAGGYYGYDYDTLDRVIQIDLSLLLDTVEPKLVYKAAAKLGMKRGDVHAVVDGEGKYAYLAGGFNHLNDFCAPLSATERYEFETDEWKTVAPMANGRGDKALVFLRGIVYAIGGETLADDWCDDKEGGNLVRDQSQVMDDVEAFDPSYEGNNNPGYADSYGRWTKIDDIPNARFRFAAAPWESERAIWVFGGQQPLDVECECHATSNIVATINFDENMKQMGGSGAASMGKMASVVGAVAGVIYGAAMLL